MPEEVEREKLSEIIRQWNINRLDLFEISQPDEKLKFHGVIRFYFEDHIEGNVATKCLRVCSSSQTQELIETLSEKFRPDMKMLTTSYSLYEIHTNKERKLDLDERPLVVQLSWKSDNREGRFVLKKDGDSLKESCLEKEKGGVIQTFKRTLSRKGKTKEKSKTSAVDKLSEDESGSTEDLLNNNTETPKHCKKNKEHRQAPEAEELFLSAVINYTNSSTVHFKLSPAYILYAACRFVLRRHYTRGSPSSEHTHHVTLITNTMVAMTGNVIQRQKAMAGALAFWMANSSELLNFLKHDKDLSPLTQNSQLNLSHQVHRAYSFLLQCLQNELRKHLPTFLIDPEQHGALPAGIEMVLNTLMNAMSLLRRCRVNPTLTIQLFSQLFHFISIWLFNQLMNRDARTPGLRSHYWGSALRQRLTAIEAWAERQGLELAADCHLGNIIQATTLLTMNKYSTQDAKDIQNTCFKLNSLQLRMLLSGYVYATNEPHIPPDLIDAVVRAAEASADNLIRSEGRDIQLEESLDLHLPFLLPEGGYSCDTVKGIPPGFREFLEPICQKGLCSLTSQPKSEGDWTVHFNNSVPSEDGAYLGVNRQPEIETITLHKPLNSGMGVSIVAAKGAGQGNLGIYIKSIVKGGPAEMNGRLAAGDQLLSVDGHNLVGLSQERAAAIMMQPGPVVTLQVAKFGASYHGLGALLSEATTEKTTSRAQPHENTSVLYCVVDLGSSERLHGGSKKKDQMMQRNRQLYRSNPNMTDLHLEDGEEPADPDARGNVTSVSTTNLCTDTFHREYLTLPNPKSKDKSLSEINRPHQTFKMSLGALEKQSSNKRAFMRQALSQENLCMDSGGPLLDKRQNAWQQRDQAAKQTQSHYSSFPIRSSLSSNDILSNHSSPTKQQQSSRTSAAGVWRMPFSQQAIPAPSVQPIRIDIPVTRAASTQSNLPLTTFQQSSSLLAVKMSQTLKVSGHTQSPQSQMDHIYACPVPAAKKLPQPQQQRSATCRGKTEKPQVSITPTKKHVSFLEDAPQQNKREGGPVRQRDPRVLCDPWKREAQEKLEKQRRLQAVEHLVEEVQELQAKAKRTAEENNRLRRLNLEWQFQKRVQEMQQRGEDEQDEEDLDMMVTLQQLENRMPHAENNRSSGGNANRELKEENQVPHLFYEEDKAKTDQRASGVHNMASEA
ncbi:afadin [Melanotaenia boesemani]|uniref:afadin n=1 Tax=Melanotaenia boesemani TaxID=1250792 RepID=UPI001C044370|nr:afadin [Melanotaenia boesemani]